MLGTTAALLGVTGVPLTMAIGWADMPVVITVLNSYSGPMEITGITTVWDVDQTVQAIADSKNIIDPRYGLAVAKGQYPVAEEVTILKAEGAKNLSQNTTSILPGTDSLVLSE